MGSSGMKYFISYANEDTQFALSLAQGLRSKNANIWMDKLDLCAGMPWDDSVEAALGECPGMILVLSPSSVASQNVKDEVAYAFDEGMTVIPVLYKHCKIPFRIRRLQYIDFTENPEKGISELLPSMSANMITQNPLGETDYVAGTQDALAYKSLQQPWRDKLPGARSIAIVAVCAAVITATPLVSGTKLV